MLPGGQKTNSDLAEFRQSSAASAIVRSCHRVWTGWLWFPRFHSVPLGQYLRTGLTRFFPCGCLIFKSRRSTNCAR